MFAKAMSGAKMEDDKIQVDKMAACRQVWQIVFLSDYILIGRMPAIEEMRSIFEIGTRNCAECTY